MFLFNLLILVLGGSLCWAASYLEKVNQPEDLDSDDNIPGQIVGGCMTLIGWILLVLGIFGFVLSLGSLDGGGYDPSGGGGNDNEQHRRRG